MKAFDATAMRLGLYFTQSVWTSLADGKKRLNLFVFLHFREQPLLFFY